MNTFSVKDLENRLIPRGRTWLNQDAGILFFNWSTSGVEFTFQGTHLVAQFFADCGEEAEGLPWDENAPRRKLWPVVAVFLDDLPMPARKFSVSSPQETWLLYESEKPETHRIRILKLTENQKTYLGLKGFRMEGVMLPASPVSRKIIEFVGDSITCGYGNGSKERDRAFFSEEEDGLLAYGPRTATALGFDCSCVCVSGITTVRHPAWPGEFSMQDLYRYTDRIYQEKCGLEAWPWPFDEHPVHYVVLNLGTNDGFAVLFSEDETDESAFAEKYLSFLREIRALNGPDTRIICTLGPMNYYLYHEIISAVDQYKRETGDPYIYSHKFKGMLPMDGYGAAGHPSMVTHEKMANELTRFIRQIEGGKT